MQNLTWHNWQSGCDYLELFCMLLRILNCILGLKYFESKRFILIMYASIKWKP